MISSYPRSVKDDGGPRDVACPRSVKEDGGADQNPRADIRMLVIWDVTF